MCCARHFCTDAASVVKKAGGCRRFSHSRSRRGSQITPFLPRLAAEAQSHKEDEVLVQKQLGYVTLKVTVNEIRVWELPHNLCRLRASPSSRPPPPAAQSLLHAGSGSPKGDGILYRAHDHHQDAPHHGYFFLPVDLLPSVGLAEILRTATNLLKRTKRRPCVDPPDKALCARREGMLGSAGSGTRGSPVPGAPTRPCGPPRGSSCIRHEFRPRTAEARSCGTPGRAVPALGQRGKSLDPKGWGRTKSLWKTSLLSHCLCAWGSCGGEGAEVRSPPPHPQPLPAVTADARAAFSSFFPVFAYPLPHLFLASTFPSFLRSKASLSVFTADLDLNVHTIKARGECQERG
ncbi:Phosphorylase B Kinase Gamma Catalytic Chain, Skeletal Muscle/Heart Isoform [Manis pentadactyla]|nr:Phosphorylase B Kinase Gamma Catalytic Chain, Skeletal Muscle/Heart Isoform [Manis pentadactyla]